MSEEIEDFDAEFEVLLDDVRGLLKRAQGAKALETKSEFAQNAYPLLESIVELTHRRISSLEDLVAEQIDPSESVIMPELTQRIAMLLSVGGRIAEVARLLVTEAQVGDETSAKIAQLLQNGAPLTDWVAGYHTEAQLLINELGELTVETEDEDEDEDEEKEGAEVEEDEEEEEEDEEE